MLDAKNKTAQERRPSKHKPQAGYRAGRSWKAQKQWNLFTYPALVPFEKFLVPHFTVLVSPWLWRQRSLKRRSFTFDVDAKGDHFGSMTHDESTKNHPGRVSDVESFGKNARMYKTSSKIDGYTGLQVFLSKLHPECEGLFQYPKRNWQQTDKIWYENRPLGVNKLSAMMKEISSEANLSRVYTNHSVRATAITLWANTGLTNREIMAIFGHRNESSLQSYHNMPSAHELRKCSDVLSLALGEDQSMEQTPNQLVVRPPLQQLQVPSINTLISTNQQSTSEFKQLFNLYTIGNFNV